MEHVLARAMQVGVVRMLCCGLHEEDWPRVAEIARAHPDQVVPAFGLHPAMLAARTPRWLDTLRGFLLDWPHAAIGEVGLEGSIEPPKPREQESVFQSQLALGREWNRPLVIHGRRVTNRLLTLLQAAGPHPAGFVLHSFRGPAEYLPLYMPLNAYFSFSGSVTWPEARRVQAALRAVPPDRLLLETDAPYLRMSDESGTGRKESSEPADLAPIACSAARIRGEPLDTVALATWNNSTRLFLRTGALP